MKDRFNRDITTRVATIYCVEGLEVEATSLENALHTLNAMAPEGWVEPEPEPEL